MKGDFYSREISRFMNIFLTQFRMPIFHLSTLCLIMDGHYTYFQPPLFKTNSIQKLHNIILHTRTIICLTKNSRKVGCSVAHSLGKTGMYFKLYGHWHILGIKLSPLQSSFLTLFKYSKLSFLGGNTVHILTM